LAILPFRLDLESVSLIYQTFHQLFSGFCFLTKCRYAKPKTARKMKIVMKLTVKEFSPPIKQLRWDVVA